MRRWLVLGAIPIASESASKPDEESQKKAFSTDWLAPHGGEAGIVPSLSAELTISGKPYRWQAVESSGDPVSLRVCSANPTMWWPMLRVKSSCLKRLRCYWLWAATMA